MNRILWTSMLLCVTAWSTAGGAAQDPATPPEPRPEAQEPEKALAQMLRQFEEAGIALDTKAGMLSVPVVVNNPPDPLEYVLIHRKGKKHEALFVTEAQPSLINAALLALGYQPGKNVDYKEKDPLPTREEMEAGADWVDVFPPEGMELWMTVRWKDEDGEHEEALETLVMDRTTGKEVVSARWIYLGGRIAPLYRGEPPVYVADYEGNLVSVCYMRPDNHFATIVHERARDEQNWWMTDACPEPGTEAVFTFHKQKPKVVEQREARLEKDGEKGSK